MINENYTTNYEVACAILDKLENGGGSTGGNIIYPNEINFTSDMEIEEIDLSNIGSDKLRYLNAFAQNSQNLRKIKGLDNFKNVSNVLSISYLYQNASNLIDDGGLHTLPFSEKVKSVSSVFMKCGLPSIDVSRWRVTYGSQLSQMFREAKATFINISNQDFSETDLGTTANPTPENTGDNTATNGEAAKTGDNQESKTAKERRQERRQQRRAARPKGESTDDDGTDDYHDNYHDDREDHEE